MRTLIRREIESMRSSANRKESLITKGVVSLVLIVLMGLLGPALFDVYDTDGMTIFIAIFGMIYAGGGVEFSIEEDNAHQQMLFLQTLPIHTSQIIHAKFLGMFLLCGETFLWMGFLVSMNQVINSDWLYGDLLKALLLASTILLLMAEHLFRYFHWGYGKKSHWINNIMRMFWITLFLIGFILMSGTWILFSFILSLVIYGVSWWLSLRRIQEHGFPQTLERTELAEIAQRADEWINKEV